MGAVTAPAVAVEPAGTAALAAQVREAAAAGRRLSPRGAGTWWPPRAAALEVSTLAPTIRVDAGDLVATVSAACSLTEVAAALRAAGAWVALDPPGSDARSIGSILATGGAGPLAARYGPPRDQVLGLSFLCGNGVVARSGGRVVKNVAGFDLAKAVIGAHGAWGVIVGAHLRLRALPGAEATVAASGHRAAVAAAASRLVAAGFHPAAFEIISPRLADVLGVPAAWALLIRCLGAPAGVADEAEALEHAVRAAGLEVSRPDAAVWERWRAAIAAAPALLRIGAAPSEWEAPVDLGERFAGLARCSITVPRGTVRVAGDLALDGVRALRREAAARGWPVTLERGPAPLLEQAGVWGPLPNGTAGLAAALRAVFDPGGVFGVSL